MMWGIEVRHGPRIALDMRLLQASCKLPIESASERGLMIICKHAGDFAIVDKNA